MKELFNSFLSAWFYLASTMVITRIALEGSCDQAALAFFFLVTPPLLLIVGILYCAFMFIWERFK